MQRAVLMGQREIGIEEAPIAQIGAGEVLIKSKVSTTCGTDVKSHMRRCPFSSRLISSNMNFPA